MRWRRLLTISSMASLMLAFPAASVFAGGWDDDRWHHGGGHWDRHGPRHGGWDGYHGRHDDNERRPNRNHFSFYFGQYYGPAYAPVPVYPVPVYPAPRYYQDGHPGNGAAFLGTLLGGGLGGIAGSHVGKGDGRTAAIIGGTLIGAMFGGNIGRSMTPYDYSYAANVLEAAPTRQVATWRNPDYGTSYQLTPMRTYQASDGLYCREYQAVAVIGGRQERSYGTACRMPDGDWRIAN